jgi:hypothetical protein
MILAIIITAVLSSRRYNLMKGFENPMSHQELYK